MGIGLNYGPVVLGDLGGEHGMAFTVIGDTVNTTSRLQDLTRILATPLVVGDALLQAIGASPDDGMASILERLSPAGDHQVRGRARPIRVWTLGPAPKSAGDTKLSG